MDIALAIFHIDPTAEYRLTDSNAQTADDILEWQSESVPKPTQEQLEAAWQEIEAAQAQETARHDALFAQVTAGAETAIGKSFSTFTEAESATLLHMLLWNANALDVDGKLKPLDDWMVLQT